MTTATLTIRRDDGAVHEYVVNTDHIWDIDGERIEIETICDSPTIRPQFTPGAEVRTKQAPSQVYTVANGVVFEIDDTPMIRLVRSSGRTFTIAMSEVYPNVTRK